jgi:hypothetical protein
MKYLLAHQNIGYCSNFDECGGEFEVLAENLANC